MNEHKDENKNVELNNENDSTQASEEQIKKSEASLVQPMDFQTGVNYQAVEHVYAGFWMRFWAYLADLIVIGSITRILVNPIINLLDIDYTGYDIFSPTLIASAVVFYLYFILMTKWSGQTLGKMIFGLKVISLKEKTLSWSTILFREGIGRFINRKFMILYVIVGIHPKKQGLHDIFADTSVVFVKNR